jgi:hypothetical protein
MAGRGYARGPGGSTRFRRRQAAVRQRGKQNFAHGRLDWKGLPQTTQNQSRRGAAVLRRPPPPRIDW